MFVSYLDRFYFLQTSGIYKSQLDEIRSHIRFGVSLQLINEPKSIHLPNTFSVKQYINEVRSRLQEYIALGAVLPLPYSSSPPSIVQPLHVVIKPNKKPRIVIDLSRNLNDHLPDRPFKYSSIRDAVRLSFPNCWYAKLDISNCFLTFPLHPHYIKFFTFELDNQYYQFVRMAFGLKPAPSVCTLLLAPIYYKLSQLGLTIVRYLDDFLFIGKTKEEVEQHLSLAQQWFIEFGFTINKEKTEGPIQRIIFLGIVLDSINCTLSIDQDRINELLDLIQQFNNKTRDYRVRSLLSLR